MHVHYFIVVNTLYSFHVDLVQFLDPSVVFDTQNQNVHVCHQLYHLEKPIGKDMMVAFFFLQVRYCEAQMKRICLLMLREDVVALESVKDCHYHSHYQVECYVDIHVSGYFSDLLDSNLLFLLIEDNHVVYSDPITFLKLHVYYILNTNICRIRMNTELTTKPLDRDKANFKGP